MPTPTRSSAPRSNLAKEFALEPVLVGASEAERCCRGCCIQKASVVLATLSPEFEAAATAFAGHVGAGRRAVLFRRQPGPAALSAVLAVVHGLDRKTALQALTRLPALLLDQQATIGSLRQACAADFLVFSGDPLDLSSAHVATWVDGVRVYGEGRQGHSRADRAREPWRPVMLLRSIARALSCRVASSVAVVVLVAAGTAQDKVTVYKDARILPSVRGPDRPRRARGRGRQDPGGRRCHDAAPGRCHRRRLPRQDDHGGSRRRFVPRRREPADLNEQSTEVTPQVHVLTASTPMTSRSSARAPRASRHVHVMPAHAT
jgi:hypothetical protein